MRSKKPDKELWKSIGIEITLTENGLHELSLMIADGCPRNIRNTKNSSIKRIACETEHMIDRKTCYKCWYKWLEEHSTKKEEL